MHTAYGVLWRIRRQHVTEQCRKKSFNQNNLQTEFKGDACASLSHQRRPIETEHDRGGIYNVIGAFVIVRLTSDSIKAEASIGSFDGSSATAPNFWIAN